MVKIHTFDPRDPKMVQDVDEYLAANQVRGDLSAINDRCVVAYDEGRVVGLLFCRPMEFLHDFLVSPVGNRRMVAEALINYTMGAAAASGYVEALGVIDKTNAPMIRFMQDTGARFQSDERDVVFTIRVR